MSHPLSYPYDASPAAGTTIQIAPGIEWLCMPLPFALNHINLWLLADGEGVAAVDTGYNLDPVKAAWKQVLAGRRLTRSIVTHCHPDHLGLAAWLEAETGAGLWMSQGDYLSAHMIAHEVGGYAQSSMTDFFAEHGLGGESLAKLVARGNSYRLGVPAIPTTYERLFDGQELRIGECSWRLIVGYGHAPEHMSLYCAERGILISGDMLLPRISTNIAVLASTPLGNPLKLFLDSIDQFRALPEDTLVLPSHGKPFRGLHARIEQLHAHHAERCGVLLDACRGEAKSAADLIAVLFGRDISDPHQTMFAMGEAIAHMNYLEHAGKMKRVGNVENGPISYITL